MLQSRHLEPLDSVIVAPIVRDATRAMTVLDVAVEVAGEALVMTVGEREQLRAVRGSLAADEEQIRRALERAFTGF